MLFVFSVTFAKTRSFASTIVFPIALSCFFDANNDKTNLLDWRDLSEVIKDYFGVPKTTDGINLERFAIVDWIYNFEIISSGFLRKSIIGERMRFSQ